MEALQNIIEELGLSQNISPSDLAILDQHHVGGLSATHKVLEHLNPNDNSSILDIGSGWGGPARIAAQKYDCRVTGIDICPKNIEAANYLNKISKTDKNVNFQKISASELDQDNQFDGAYMMHVSMCIKDKENLIRACYKAIKPNGLFTIYDIFINEEKDTLSYPLPWSDKANYSYPEQVNKMLSRLEENGFDIIHAENLSAYAKDKSTKALSYIENNEFAAKATQIHLGKNYHQKMRNVNAALLANICAPHMIIAIKK
jgi:2-polyprenyl-3-methyl-5-hydroxy-6-metoxy-1,4-benzoquinol methylase